MLKADYNFTEGEVLLIDKPIAWTSFDAVKKIRNTIKIKKVGHAGTLDPLATGLLIICTGKFTKKIDEYQAQEKEYTGTFTLGATTVSGDLEQEVIPAGSIEHITEEAIHNATKPFTGDIKQIPPAHSAIKVDGERVYKKARKGIEVVLKPRAVTIHSFEITAIDLPVVSFKVVCSKGTYIRSLAMDFGQELGCGAYLSELRRTRIGEFSIDNALSLNDFITHLKQPS